MSILHARKRRPAHRATPVRHRRGLIVKAATGTALTAGLLGVSLPAHAAGPVLAGATTVMTVAQDYVGVPYVYGGSTPAGFDCSGYTKWVFARAGIALPHSADGQMRASQRVSSSSAVPGDLVFFVSGSHAYHVAVYAGNGQIYDAPRPGGRVAERAIWSSSVVYGRVLGAA